jgi:hypothetical protein
VLVKKKVNPETELAKFPSQTLVTHTVKSTETQVARLAIIWMVVDGATTLAWTPIKLLADQLLIPAIPSAVFTSTAILATTIPTACGVRAPVPALGIKEATPSAVSSLTLAHSVAKLAVHLATPATIYEAVDGAEVLMEAN